MTVLCFDRVHFGYGGRPAIDDLTLSVDAGEGVALLGPNGAGKTTAARLAMALEQPDRGEVTVAGASTRGRQPEDLAAAVGFLFQDPRAQLVERTVQLEVAFGPRALGWEESRVSGAVADVLGQLGLTEVAGSHPYDLPLPTQRLVGLGSVLVAGPRLLLLDEPTAGLDRMGRERVCRVVGQHRAKGTAVVAATHDVGFAIEALDRGILLSEGRVLADGSLAGLLDEAWDIEPPVAMAVSRALGFPPTVNRLADVARAVAALPVEAP